MKKKEIWISVCVISGAVVLGLVFALVGGFLFKGRCHINEFKAYKDLPLSAARIEIIVDAADSAAEGEGDGAAEGDEAESESGIIEITHSRDVDEIMKILFERVYKRGKKQAGQEKGVVLKIYDQSGKDWLVNSHEIKSGNGYYYSPKKADNMNVILSVYVSL